MLKVLAVVCLLFATATLFGGVAGFKGEPYMTPPLFSTNTSHFYALVYDPIRSFNESVDRVHRYRGLTGYLATLAQPDELNTLKRIGLGDGFSENDTTIHTFWLGGSDRETEGVWKWVTGPEAGQVFYTHINNTCYIPVCRWRFYGQVGGEPNGGTAANWLELRAGLLNVTYDPTNRWSWHWNDEDNFHEDIKLNYTNIQGYFMEFGGMPNDTYQPPSSIDPNKNASLVFLDNSLTHTLYLKNFEQQAYIRFDFLNLIERTPSGTAVRTFSFAGLELFSRWANPNGPPEVNEVFDYVADLGFGGRAGGIYTNGRANVRFVLFGEETTINYAGKDYTMEPSMLKWSLEVLYWNFSSTSNHLELNMKMSTADNATITGVTKTNTDPQTLQVVLTTSAFSQVVLQLPLKVLINGENGIQDMVKEPVVNATTLQFFFPHFNKSLNYDPTLSLLLGDDSDGGDGDGDGVFDTDSDGGDGDGGDGGGSDSGLIVGLTVGLFVGAAVVVLITAGIVAFIGAWFKFNLGQKIFGTSASSIVFEE